MVQAAERAGQIAQQTAAATAKKPVVKSALATQKLGSAPTTAAGAGGGASPFGSATGVSYKPATLPTVRPGAVGERPGNVTGQILKPKPASPPSPQPRPSPGSLFDLPENLPPGTSWTDTGGQLFAGVPEQWEYWKVGSANYLVYKMPTGSGSEYVPIAYSMSLRDVGELFPNGPPDFVRNVTPDEFGRAGAVTGPIGSYWAGTIDELNLTSDEPFFEWSRKLAQSAETRPWLLDPEIAAVYAQAYLEGRPVDDIELQGTQWYQTHSAAEREWLTFNATNPEAAEQSLLDNRIAVANALRAAGVNNADEPLINAIADPLTKGEWSETYTTEQIRLISDPAASGALDAKLTAILTGRTTVLDTTQAGMSEVQNIYREWLGPLFGELDAATQQSWAAQLRNDPDAQDRLISTLQQQRQGLFPGYDPTLTYDQIAAPWKNLMANVWGQTNVDSNPLLRQLINTNDVVGAETLLRSEGLSQGVPKVTEDFLGGLIGAFG